MNQQAFEQAKKVLVGGVNSPVRSCRAVGGAPRFIVRGQGPYVEDIAGKRYVDYVGSFGASIAGHAHPQVLQALQKQMADGLGFSAPHPAETALAEVLLARLPYAERVRFMNSGTEAVQTAIRLARGITGRTKIVKFAGGYHGHVDCMLVEAGSGALTLGKPSSAGVTSGAETIVAAFNNLDDVRQRVAPHQDDVAAIIVEPVAGNMGCVLPTADFLPGLRQWCDEIGALLIFDEVMTGFRVHHGSAQGLYGVAPDLTTLGKVIGGGLPVGAVVGPHKHMTYLAPEGPVYQAGTLSGNPMTMTAGLATMAVLQEGYDQRLAAHTSALADSALALAQKHALPLDVQHVGGMWGLFFSAKPVRSYADVQHSHIDWFPLFYHAMLSAGVYWPPSAYEAVFISIQHNEESLEQTVYALDRAFETLAEKVQA